MRELLGEAASPRNAGDIDSLVSEFGDELLGEAGDRGRPIG